MKGWRTIIFNVLATLGQLVFIWTGVDTSGDVVVLQENFVEIESAVISLWGIGNVWLRSITNTPVGKKA